MNEWRVRGSYFEGCNCEAICPCRAVHGRPGGPSTYGECFAALSWIVEAGHAGDLDLSGLSVVMTLRYFDNAELYGGGLEATDPLLRFEVRGKRHASFFTDFEYRSERHA